MSGGRVFGRPNGGLGQQCRPSDLPHASPGVKDVGMHVPRISLRAARQAVFWAALAVLLVIYYLRCESDPVRGGEWRVQRWLDRDRLANGLGSLHLGLVDAIRGRAD